MDNKKSRFHVDPEIGFFQQKPVRATFCWCAVLFIIASILSVASSVGKAEICFSPECINYLVFTVLRIPFGIAAVGVVVLTLFATHLRSEQTRVSLEKTEKALRHSERQMELARDQNNFSNFFESMKQFHDHMEPFGERVVDYRLLHSIVYTDPINGNFEASRGFGDIIQTCIDTVLSASSAFKDPLDERMVADAIESVQQAEADFYSSMKFSVSPGENEFSAFVAASPSWEIDQGLTGVLEEGKGTASWLSGIRDILLLVERVLTFLPGKAGSLGYILLYQVDSLRSALEEVPDSRISPTLENFEPFDLRKMSTDKFRELYPMEPIDT